MESIILYGSRYGSAKRYAQALSQQTGISALPADQAGDLSSYGRVIFLGGVYAGGVSLKRMRQRFSASSQSWLMMRKVPISAVLATCVPMHRHSS